MTGPETIPQAAKMAIAYRDASGDRRDIYEATITVRIHADSKADACESLALMLADEDAIAELYDVRAENYCWHTNDQGHWHPAHRAGCEVCNA